MPDTFQRVEWVDEIKKKERDTATRRKKERKKERKEERKKGRERDERDWADEGHAKIPFNIVGRP